MTFWSRNDRKRRTLRDYSRRRYGNPLYPPSHRRPRGPRRSVDTTALKRRAALGAAAAVIAAAFWAVFYGPWLRIASMTVTGASQDAEETIRAALQAHADGRAMLVLPRSNVLLFDVDKATDAVRDVVALESIEVRRKLPNEIIVDVREKTSRAVFDAHGRFYALDGSGLVIRELAGREIARYPDLPPGVDAVLVGGLGAEMVDLAEEVSVDDGPAKTNRNPMPLIIEGDAPSVDAAPQAKRAGSQAVSASTLALILQAYARLPDIAGAGVRWLTVQASTETVDATMAGDWHILLSTAIPFDLQAERLGLVLKEKIGAKRTLLDYVDLRYNERIFFRLKDGQPSGAE